MVEMFNTDDINTSEEYFDALGGIMDDYKKKILVRNEEIKNKKT